MKPSRGKASAHGRKRWYLAIAAVAGVGLFAWTVMSVGVTTLVAQLRALAPVLPLILLLAGARFLFQTAGWRFAMVPSERPSWREAFGAVVAGEAAGYFAWGPVSREPMKALLVGHRLPKRAALAAAVVERLAYGVAAATLIVVALALAAVRYHFVGWFLAGLAATTAVALAATRYWTRFSRERRYDRATMIGLAACAAAQEMTNLVEAYVVLGWLGAAPTLASVVVLEGISRLMNGVGQFIPGKLGVTEAATTALAEGLRLGAAPGLSLALARRIRSLSWGALGIALVVFRAVNWQALLNDAISYLRNRNALHGIPARGLPHRVAVD